MHRPDVLRGNGLCGVLSPKIAITNDDGTLINQQRYMPFGQVRYLPGTPAITNTDFGYTGQRNLDSEMGLMDYKARFYSPLLGRFVQPDTIVPAPLNPQTWNRYTYTNNNPVRYSDPSGHYFIVPILLLIAGAFILSSCAPSPHERIQEAIDQAKSSGDPKDYQNAIDVTVEAYNIDVSKMNGGPSYNPSEVLAGTGGETTPEGVVNIGDEAFDSPDHLIDVIAHENIHAIQASDGRYYVDPIGKAINELEAYQYMADHTEEFGLSDRFYLFNTSMAGGILDDLIEKTQTGEITIREYEIIRDGNYYWKTPAVPTPKSLETHLTPI